MKAYYGIIAGLFAVLILVGTYTIQMYKLNTEVTTMVDNTFEKTEKDIADLRFDMNDDAMKAADDTYNYLLR